MNFVQRSGSFYTSINRKQISSLSHVHRKDVQQINDTLENFRCRQCIEQENLNATPGEAQQESIPPVFI